MQKFTVEYSRSVRVREYETLRVGMLMEFNAATDDPQDAHDWIKEQVNKWVAQDRYELQNDPTR